MKAILSLLLLAVGFVWQGCTAISESTSEYDMVLGPNYTPSIAKLCPELPAGRILFLPVRDSMAQDLADKFVSKFIVEFNQRGSHELILPINNGKALANLPTREEAEALAKQQGCSMALFARLEHASVYQPLHLRADVLLQQVDGEKTLWKGIADYDAGQDVVANSARRYYQKVLKKTDAPDKSLAILHNNYIFIEFTAWHLANYLNQLTETPSPEHKATSSPEKSYKK